jgi:hypothetical protein
MKLVWTIVVALVSLTAFAAPVRAQGLGVRAGASSDPDRSTAACTSRRVSWSST